MTAAAASSPGEFERRAHVQAEVDASAPARRRHLSAALTAVTDDVARRRLLDAILAPLEEPGGDVDPLTRYGGVLEVLGIAQPTTSNGDRAAAAEDLRRVLQPTLWSLSLPALVLVLDVVRYRYAEARLTDTDPGAEGRSDAVHDWLMVLWEEYGYEPSDFESSRASDDRIGRPEAVQGPGDEPGPNAMTVTYDGDNDGRPVVF